MDVDLSDWSSVTGAEGEPEPPFSVRLSSTWPAAVVLQVDGTIARHVAPRLHQYLLDQTYGPGTETVICELSGVRMCCLEGADAIVAAARAAVRREVRFLIAGPPPTVRALLHARARGVRLTVVPELDNSLEHVGLARGAGLCRGLAQEIGRALAHLRPLCAHPRPSTDAETWSGMCARLHIYASPAATADPAFLEAAASVRAACAHLAADNPPRAYFALLTAEDYLAHRLEPPTVGDGS